MKCTDCRYCLEVDTGYSNWTVEGTTAHCLLNLNPGLPFDRFYREEPALDFAAQCLGFSQGDGVSIDVDRELLHDYRDPLSSAYTTDPEIAALLDKWEASNEA